MKNDLISRSALKEELAKNITIWTFNVSYDGILAEIIDNAPIVEPEEIAKLKRENKALEQEMLYCRENWKKAERLQGEWIVVNQDNEGIHEIKCPFCQHSKGSDFSSVLTVTFERFPPFCENCGAELKGGTE